MKPRAVKSLPFLLLLLCASLPLRPAEFQAGLRLSLNSAIGTGKGFWDWYDKGAETQRFLIPAASGNLLLHLDTGKNWAVESGIGISDNRCGLKVNGKKYLYSQPSVEIPLSAKVYFSETAHRLYLKSGPSLILLTGKASFADQENSSPLFSENSPDNVLHGGLHAGFGLERKTGTGRWIMEFLYTTFYSSPGYTRTDGSTGNVRFHRFELGWGYLF